MLQAYWRPTTGSGNNYLDRIDYGYDYAGNRTYRNVRGDLIAGASVDERDQAYPPSMCVGDDVKVGDKVL